MSNINTIIQIMKSRLSRFCREFLAGKKILTVTIAIVVIAFTLHAQGTWTQKADFGGDYRTGAVGFSIGDKGYVGTGSSNSDFWEYDPASDTWTQKADFAGGGRTDAVGFSIGNHGFLGTGSLYSNSFWEYNPLTNTWTERASFPGTARTDAVGFSIGTKGYIGTGYHNGGLSDFWEYDPASNEWTQKANFGGGLRHGASGFSIGSKGYLGTGLHDGVKADFWEYDPETDVWTQKSYYAGGACVSATGFSIGKKGYLGTGSIGRYGGGHPMRAFWQYDPTANNWIKVPFDGQGRSAAISFSIANKGYVGLGYGYNSGQDFWEYDPDGFQKQNAGNSESGSLFSLYPNPTTGTFTLDLQLDDEETSHAEVQIINLLGQTISIESGELKVENGKLVKEIQLNNDAAEGMYLVKVIINDKIFTSQINLQK